MASRTRLGSLAAFACASFLAATAVPASAFTAHTFTPCGASGVSGPSQSACRATYATSWDESDSDYYVTDGIQYWRVPQTGQYLVAASGAQGGNSGGAGARRQGVFTFAAGTWVRILVGQVGSGTGGCQSIMDVRGCNVPQTSGGGGGGSFVTADGGSPLVVAGGGGGASNQASGDASATTATTALTGPSFTYSTFFGRSAGGGSGGTDGAGGGTAPVPNYQTCTDSYWISGDRPPSDCHGGGGGGGGITGSGGTAYSYNRGGRGGSSFSSGGSGGSPDGGFGGGAGTGRYFIYEAWQRSGVTWQIGGAGGGGGYSGGGGGSGGYEAYGGTFNGAGGGGSSYLADSAAQGASSTGATGDGSVTVTRLSPDAPPALEQGSSKVAKGNVLKGSGIDYTGGGGSPTSTAYNWQRCTTLDDASSCSDIAGGNGADGAWWGTRDADIGRQVRLSVTWTTALGVVSAFSDLSGLMGPAASSPPVLSDTSPVKNTRIHSTFGVWDGYVTGVSTVSFEWQVCSSQTDAATCVVSPTGTNSQWYRPTAANVGHYLRVTATISTRGQAVSSSSAITSAVRATAVLGRARAAVVSKLRVRSRR